MLREIAEKAVAATGQSILKATDYMDDGSQIQLTIQLDPIEASNIFFVSLGSLPVVSFTTSHTPLHTVFSLFAILRLSEYGNRSLIEL